MSNIKLRSFLSQSNLPISSRVGALFKNGYGDNGYISGRVTELGMPVVRRVMCYHRHSGALMGVTKSKSDGTYLFKNLLAGSYYFVVSLDENEDEVQYNLVAQDKVIAKLI
jgi:hypothetical protein